jgi:hypothetical protein
MEETPTHMSCNRMPHRRAALSRLAVACALVGLLAAPVSSATAQDVDQLFAPVAGIWARHGFGIQVNDDGTASADWRVYRWCGPGVTDPCDQLLRNRIIDGGHADITFSGLDENGAFQGEVASTTDPELLDIGPLNLTRQPYDMAMLEQNGTQLTLCGDDSPNEAPPEVLMACGA